MAWWSWTVLGLALLVVELVTPGGLFAFFFGLGALVVAALVALGVGGSPPVQWLSFAAVSLVALALLRRPVQRRMARKGRAEELVGEVAIPLEDLAVGGVGKAELRGTSWEARNAGEAALARGQRCHVVRVEGLTLWIAAE